MSSLTSCIRKAGKKLNNEDKAAILQKAREYRSAGKPSSESAKESILDQISYLEAVVEKNNSLLKDKEREPTEALKMTKLQKEKYVRVTMDFEEYLTRWCGMYYTEAEVLARVLGFDSAEEDSTEQEEPQSWEEYINEKVANIEIVEKAKNSKKYSDIAPDVILKIKTAVDAVVEIKKVLDNKDSAPAIPILKSADELKKEILFVCYEPNVEDAHGEWTDEATLRKACKDFNKAMEDGKVFPNLFHAKDDEGSYIQTDSFSIQKSYIAESDCIIGDQKVSEGTWLMLIKIKSDTLWDLFLDGTVKGISIGCKGVIGEE